MAGFARTEPAAYKVNRSKLRQDQSSILRKVKGNSIVAVGARGKGEEKYIVEKAYFERLVRERNAALETLAIAVDRKLFPRLLRITETIAGDARHGRLHSFEDVFGE